MAGIGIEEKDKPRTVYFMNELLFYVQNAKNSETKQDVVQKCSEFYSETEVEIAKAYLWNKCENYYSEKLQKRKAPDKLVKNVVDIVDFVYNLDWNQCPVRFAAIDATRVPSMVCKNVNINDKKENDLCMTNVVRELHDMKKQIEFLTKTIQTLTTNHETQSKDSSNILSSNETDSRQER